MAFNGAINRADARRMSEEEQMRVAIALSHSAHVAAAPRPTLDSAAQDAQRLRAATAASERAFIAEHNGMMQEVQGVLRGCSPILASYIDEHCAVFGVGGGGPHGREFEMWSDYRRTVDTLLTDMLSEVSIEWGEVARTLQLAREQPDTSGGSIVTHLLAVESFGAFRNLSMQAGPQQPSHCPVPARTPRPRPDPPLLSASSSTCRLAQ